MRQGTIAVAPGSHFGKLHCRCSELGLFGRANKVLDGSPSFQLHPSPRSVGHACFGSCRLLGEVEGQAARLDPLAEVRHLILERESNCPYVAIFAEIAKL